MGGVRRWVGGVHTPLSTYHTTSRLHPPHPGKVLSVTLTMNLSRLEALVNERGSVHRKLDHLLMLYGRTDDRTCVRVG